jgi:hypothetical protein
MPPHSVGRSHKTVRKGNFPKFSSEKKTSLTSPTSEQTDCQHEIAFEPNDPTRVFVDQKLTCTACGASIAIYGKDDSRDNPFRHMGQLNGCDVA